jgi:hypothetical protein
MSDDEGEIHDTPFAIVKCLECGDMGYAQLNNLEQ